MCDQVEAASHPWPGLPVNGFVTTLDCCEPSVLFLKSYVRSEKVKFCKSEKKMRSDLDSHNSHWFAFPRRTLRKKVHCLWSTTTRKMTVGNNGFDLIY